MNTTSKISFMGSGHDDGNGRSVPIWVAATAASQSKADARDTYPLVS